MGKVAKKQSQKVAQKLPKGGLNRKSRSARAAADRAPTAAEKALLADWKAPAQMLLQRKFRTVDEAVAALIETTLTESGLADPKLRKELEAIIRDDEELIQELKLLLVSYTK